MYIKDQNESLSDFFLAETDESKPLWKKQKGKYRKINL